MLNVETKLIEIFCHIDDFNNVFIRELQTHQRSDGPRKRIKPCKFRESEVMTIVICFHLMRYRDFKHYYLFHVCRNMTSEFPNLVSCNRFVELSNKSLLLPLVAYLKTPSDKIMQRKRALAETVFDELKNICQIEHTRHRSQMGFIVNLISGLIAYYYLPKKPSLNLEVIDPSMALAC
ncbi:MAG: transposase [Bacteroidota bacterium]